MRRRSRMGRGCAPPPPGARAAAGSYGCGRLGDAGGAGHADNWERGRDTELIWSTYLSPMQYGRGGSRRDSERPGSCQVPMIGLGFITRPTDGWYSGILYRRPRRSPLFGLTARFLPFHFSDVRSG